MAYHLLTGATGLLGTYLLRDALLARHRVAVVVRPGSSESPRQRIESILARWERKLDCVLPRPPVLEGDICQADLGLDRAAIQWVAQHCVGVLHSAASLSFTANLRTGEPFRSNVEGTRNVLELCRKTGIHRFHYVSTSYVCGLRGGRAMEDELDVGQQWGNDYEKSKVEAEKLVRGVDFLDPPTVYRPAIIVGDAATGYSTTFHGFYSPLKIGRFLVERFTPESIDGRPLVAALGLQGTEQKNFVPVDWVSRLITYLCGCPEHHGRTYHLVPARPVLVALWRAVIEQALGEYAQRWRERSPVAPRLAEMQDTFADQMGAYRAYWRDDPEFDRTNTVRAAPHLAACEVDFEMLLGMARYALTTEFGCPRPRPERPRFDVAEHLGRILPISVAGDGVGKLKVGLEVNGPGGGQWTLAVHDRRPVCAWIGLGAELGGVVHLNSTTFEQCAFGHLAPEDAAGRGLLAHETGDLSPERLLAVFAACVGSPR